MSLFLRAAEVVLGVEGGYVDDPQDRGGPTNWGVSLRALLGLPAEERRVFDIDRDGDLDREDVRAMPREAALDLYRRRYWDAIRCGEMPGPVALLAFDCAVNQGPATAATLLQAAARVRMDGRIGPLTLAALRRRDSYEMAADYAGDRALHYVGCRDFARFGRGWLDRLALVTIRAGQFPAS